MTVIDEHDQHPATCAGTVDPSGLPFLRARFTPPSSPDGFLRRERLTEKLDRALITPLTVVNGSAGAGKTLAVADWAAGLDIPVAWLTVEEADRAPGLFWAYVLEALRAVGVSVPEEVGSPSDADSVDRGMLSRLAAALQGRDRPVVLVLDAYGRVTTPEIAEQLEFVLRHAGEGLRLVLATCTDPLLLTHRYRASGELTEIRDTELAFTRAETVELLRLHGLYPSRSATHALTARTQGWAAGLKLCAMAARQSSDPETYLREFEAGRSAVADFLLAEALDPRPPGTQDLLLRVSVLERFCPDLANAMTLRTDAEPTLAALCRENAFVQYLGHSWYRLQPLFREVLRAHLRERAPGLETEVRRRAALWLRRAGLLPEALAQGAAAGDWEFTAGLVVGDLAIGQLFTGVHSADLSHLFARMSPDATGPAADLVRAACELAHRELEPGLHHLHHAEECLDGNGSGQGAPSPDGNGSGPAAARLSCALLEALSARLTGSPGRAEQAAEAAQTLTRDVPARLLGEHPEVTALVLTHLGSARLWAGRFEDARVPLSAVAGRKGGAQMALPRLECLGHLALIDYLDGWLGRAESRALEAGREAKRYGLPRRSGSGIGQLVLAAVLVDRDELDEAEALLEDMAGSGAVLEDPVTQASRAIITGRLLLARGDTRAALEAANSTVPAVVHSPWAEDQAALVTSAAHLARGCPEKAEKVLAGVAEDRPACAIEAARVRLASGHRDDALDMIDSLFGSARPGPAVTVRADLVRAQAAHQAGDTATVRRLVSQALLAARRDRLRRPFLDIGSWILPVLDTDQLRPLAQDWLLTGSDGHGSLGRTTVELSLPVLEELSGRELDVLRRLAQLMSTQEIAADLFVSVNTVKTHLKGLYRKLAVNRRSDAVRRARDLGLL
ncbi:LuxR C-terminal-related transcriptional regulator [Streptomyces sp. NPDC058067]|uniref:helix-turn-helix transcriptional regulator n=1 Tax=Streptomyces sp. NPDC058067 TaxID=3346324 RepID=UPI0036EFF896